MHHWDATPDKEVVAVYLVNSLERDNSAGDCECIELSAMLSDNVRIPTTPAADSGLFRTLCGSFRSCGHEDALAQQRKACAAVCGSLDYL